MIVDRAGIRRSSQPQEPVRLRGRRRGLAATLSLSMALTLAACSNQAAVDRALRRMRQQPRYDRYAASATFANGAVIQPPPEGTVPRDAVLDARLGNGREPNGQYIVESPLPVTPALVARGRSRFDIFCAVCHGTGGDGVSIVGANMIERPPPSLLRPELRALPDGYFYDVIQHGLGRMPSYAAELSAQDRWAVIAYLRRLQGQAGSKP